MGQFEEGHNFSRGRKKGSKNKLNTDIKHAFDLCFENLGGVGALEAWAKKQPGRFYSLYAKLAPREIDLNLRQHENFVEGLAERELIEEAEAKMLEAHGEVVGDNGSNDEHKLLDNKEIEKAGGNGEVLKV